VNPSEPLLSLSLSVDYPGKPRVIRDATIRIGRGEILGLVGQSGSGKSTIALSILRLLGIRGASARGEIIFRGRQLMPLTERQMRHVRGREIGLVLQSPLSALNPSLRIGTQLHEAWRAHATGPTDVGRQAILKTLESVSLPSEDAFLRNYPRQLSVGLAQRVLIAMAVLHRPALLIADEPTSALDVITQSEILALFARLNRELSMAILYISHDLLTIASLCHRVAILHDGEIVECSQTEQIFRNPKHPYTCRLIASLPGSPFAAPDEPQPG
jgi:ABC-type dipeptide/oligopeptide/nickel transport system ATPase component